MTAAPASATAVTEAPRSIAAVHAEMTLRSLVRRRLTVVILVLLPLAFYLATNDAVGRSVRSLVFGITWAVSTVAFFVTSNARDVEPRLQVAGVPASTLTRARVTALAAAALALALAFWLIVVFDQDVRSVGGVALDFGVSALVAVSLGTAVGSLLRKELEGTLVLFLFAGLQAVVNPADRIATLLPFWSSRELATYAVDGPSQGSLSNGLIHATVIIAVCAAISWLASRRPATP